MPSLADVVLKELKQEEPTVAMWPGDAADLGSRRRGAEPLRIVIMPQQDQQTITAPGGRTDAGSCVRAVVQMTVCDAPRPT